MIKSEHKILWMVINDSTSVRMLVWDWETASYYCMRHRNGSVVKTPKKLVGIDIGFYYSWEAGNNEVVRRAECKLAKALKSIPHMKQDIERLKKRTMRDDILGAFS